MRVPLLSIAITPHTPADQERLLRGLQVMMAEDPTLSMRIDTAAGEVIVGAISELQIEIVVARLGREFGVSASLERLQVEYHERLGRSADGEMKLATRVDGVSRYAHVKLRLAPREPGAGNLVVNEILSGAIPDEFLPAIDEGVDSALDYGVLAGYPLIDVAVTLYDGSYHDVDSTGAAFAEAAYLAFREAALRARPFVVEPVMCLEVSFPARQKPQVLETLRARGTQFQHLDERDQRMVLFGLAPLANLFGFARHLGACTDGRASYTLSLHGYEPVRSGADEEERGGIGVREPLRPRPSARSGSISLPLDEF